MQITPSRVGWPAFSLAGAALFAVWRAPVMDLEYYLIGIGFGVLMCERISTGRRMKDVNEIHPVHIVAERRRCTIPLALSVFVTLVLVTLWTHIRIMPFAYWTLWYRLWSTTGVLVSLTGLTTLLGSTRQLGSYWVNGSAIQQNQPFMTTQWYAVCQHPVYLGQMLWVSGVCLIIGGPIPALLWILLASRLSRTRMINETRLLHEHFGPVYDAYANSMRYHHLRPRLRPWIRALWTVWHAGLSDNRPVR